MRVVAAVLTPALLLFSVGAVADPPAGPASAPAPVVAGPRVREMPRSDLRLGLGLGAAGFGVASLVTSAVLSTMSNATTVQRVSSDETSISPKYEDPHALRTGAVVAGAVGASAVVAGIVLITTSHLGVDPKRVDADGSAAAPLRFRF
jgi:hypothetical protein